MQMQWQEETERFTAIMIDCAISKLDLGPWRGSLEVSEILLQKLPLLGLGNSNEVFPENMTAGSRVITNR